MSYIQDEDGYYELVFVADGVTFGGEDFSESYSDEEIEDMPIKEVVVSSVEEEDDEEPQSDMALFVRIKTSKGATCLTKYFPPSTELGEMKKQYTEEANVGSSASFYLIFQSPPPQMEKYDTQLPDGRIKRYLPNSLDSETIFNVGIRDGAFFEMENP